MTWLCVDFGSTWTKACAVDAERGLLATASHPTTLETDILDGYEAVRADLAAQGVDVEACETIACSSAGGGLRIAVIGNESLVTSEAGRRVSLSSGGHVVAVISGGLTPERVDELVESRPDLVLLCGGTDGGNAATLLESARTLGRARLGIPVVVAGDASVADEVSALLGTQPHVVADNVVPEIGVFHPRPAREAVRETFLTHVIGGKGLSQSPRFAQMVTGATPDIVLRGTELLAQVAGDVMVVDVGGATTDVHSVVEVEHPEPREDETGEVLSSDVVGLVPATRTVEGDLGMRWSARTTAAAGRSEHVIDEDAALDAWVERLTADALPATPEEDALDGQLARAAMATALRRHAGFSEVMFVNGQRIVRQTGTDVREVNLLIGSGGVLRADPATGVARLADALAAAHTPGRMLPRHARFAVDASYLLAPIGLLCERDPECARRLAQDLADASR